MILHPLFVRHNTQIFFGWSLGFFISPHRTFSSLSHYIFHFLKAFLRYETLSPTFYRMSMKWVLRFPSWRCCFRFLWARITATMTIFVELSFSCPSKCWNKQIHKGKVRPLASFWFSDLESSSLRYLSLHYCNWALSLILFSCLWSPCWSSSKPTSCSNHFFIVC